MNKRKMLISVNTLSGKSVKVTSGVQTLEDGSSVAGYNGHVYRGVPGRPFEFGDPKCRECGITLDFDEEDLCECCQERQAWLDEIENQNDAADQIYKLRKEEEE